MKMVGLYKSQALSQWRGNLVERLAILEVVLFMYVRLVASLVAVKEEIMSDVIIHTRRLLGFGLRRN
jgi:hypothetical protein